MDTSREGEEFSRMSSTGGSEEGGGSFAVNGSVAPREGPGLSRMNSTEESEGVGEGSRVSGRVRRASMKMNSGDKYER